MKLARRGNKPPGNAPGMHMLPGGWARGVLSGRGFLRMRPSRRPVAFDGVWPCTGEMDDIAREKAKQLCQYFQSLSALYQKSLAKLQISADNYGHRDGKRRHIS